METRTEIADQLQRTFDGAAWHGDAVFQILQGVTPEQAAQRVLPKAHTIWELVLHITAWEEVVLKSLRGEPYVMLHGEDDWPPVRDTRAAAWLAAIARLKDITERLRQAMLSFPEARLRETIPGQNFTFYIAMHGIVHHNLYHAGQMAILKKMAV